MARILVIDDNSDIHYMLGEFLTDDGHTADFAEDGKVGLARASENHYDLIITDILMPKMDGIEVITEIRKSVPDINIIAMTGGSAKIDKNLLVGITRAMGVNAIIKKPLDMIELLSTINRLLAV